MIDGAVVRPVLGSFDVLVGDGHTIRQLLSAPARPEWMPKALEYAELERIAQAAGSVHPGRRHGPSSSCVPAEHRVFRRHAG